MDWKLEYQGLLLGQPVALGRPRVGKNGRLYTPRTSREYQQFQLEALGGKWEQGKLEGAIRIQMTFISKRPKRIKTKGRTWKNTKPDLDNHIKMVLDILTKWGIWEDDNQVTSLQAEDFYASENEEPHTIFTIYTKEKT